VTEACAAGDSMWPRVERSGTRGFGIY